MIDLGGTIPSHCIGKGKPTVYCQLAVAVFYGLGFGAIQGSCLHARLLLRP